MKKLILLMFAGTVTMPLEAQTCTSYTTPVHVLVGDGAPSGPYPNTACVTVGGSIYWKLDPHDKAGSGTVTFSSSPFQDNKTTANTDGVYHTVLSSTGQYHYSVSYQDGAGVTQSTSGYLTIGGSKNVSVFKARASACTKESAVGLKMVSMVIESNKKIGLHDNGTDASSICVYDTAEVSWDADNNSILAWTFVFKDQNHIPVDKYYWSTKQDSWSQVKCSDCVPQKPKSHKYQILAIGTDGKVYRMDPDIIVVSDVAVHPGQAGSPPKR